MSTHRSVQERSPADDGRPERAMTASGALAELLETAAESLGGHTAWSAAASAISHDELAERVARLAHGLAGLGVWPRRSGRAGDARHAGVRRRASSRSPACGPRRPARPALQGGGARLLHARLRRARRDRGRPTRRRCAATWCPPGTRASRSSPPVRQARAAPRSRSTDRREFGRCRSTSARPDEDVVLQYSAGCTGGAKRVPRTQAQLRAEADSLVATARA